MILWDQSTAISLDVSIIQCYVRFDRSDTKSTIPQLTHYHFCCFAHEQLCTTFQLTFLGPVQPLLIRGGLSRRFHTLDGRLCIRSGLQWLLPWPLRSISLQQMHSCAFVTRLTEQFEHEHLQNNVKNSSNTRKIRLDKIINCLTSSRKLSHKIRTTANHIATKL